MASLSSLSWDPDDLGASPTDLPKTLKFITLYTIIKLNSEGFSVTLMHLHHSKILRHCPP